ncbi:MAG: protein-L-isoaspartate O-methyltransferase [Planctomycetes bacterium GWA2_50_13]|nr:MAG: protein-L-isoaspartate O-methyltransferase [Planctomycetes bacterium GWA2_50_13]OHB96137.1 MAG: protein-L-isoaspartate O-methyltransferase [Planctomycetes bacterium RIFCSPLOWO2_02_FULL_50_16]OHC02817.1 MAG: protein-L-isoaspartate O-methyltransferase [Planctomycetes bacterium RIFCSPLOWO2_12_FULL_50_35]
MRNEFKSLYSILIAVLLSLTCLETETACGIKEDLSSYDEAVYERERTKMVEWQIKARGVKDPRVLKAMQSVPRHLFIPEGLRQHSYEDTPVPIGSGQTISQPYIVAFMTELLDLDKNDTVLEVGTGSGYQAAVLAEIVKQVFTIEINEKLGLEAEERLKEMGYTNIDVRIGDGYNGLPDEAPFDAIIVTAAPTHIPQPLVDQLRPGGRMVIPVGPSYETQSLVLITKKEDGEILRETITLVRFVPLLRER